MSDPGASSGFISGGGRPPFFRYVLRLYSGDQVFRGLIDFAAIGGVVLLFLHPPSMNWFRGWMTHQAAPATQPSAPARPTPSAPPAAKPAANPPASPSPPKASAPAPANPTVSGIVPMPFLEDVRRPRLNVRFLFEIDEKAFFGSEPEDRPRLRKAAQAYHEFRYADMLDTLAGARSSDPNVAFMRGVASLYAMGGPAALEQLRAAASGGQKQAATILGVVLVTGPRGVDKDVEAGKRLIEEAAAKGDRTAQRAAGIGYLTGEFGVLDPFKAAAYFKSAATAGDIAAMPHYAHMLFTGTGVAKDEGDAEELIERAAGAGLTLAQETLGAWILDRYKAGVISDPSEGVQLLEKAYQRGFSIAALDRLAAFYSSEGRGPQWQNRVKSFELSTMTAAFADSRSQYRYANSLQFGYSGNRDLVKAYTHFELARQLGASSAEGRLKTLDDMLSPAEKASAVEAARLLRRELKPIPRVIVMQYQDLPKQSSPWVVPAQPVADPPAPAQQPVADPPAPAPRP